MDIDGTKYYFKIGDKNLVIIRLKKIFNSLRYITTKNNNTEVFDEQLKSAVAEYQKFWKMTRQDGFINAEVYKHLGKYLLPVQIDQISLGHPILKKLFYGVGLVPNRFGMKNGVPVIIQNDVTPIHPTPGENRILASNGNAADQAIDDKLAILFGDARQKPVVNGANQAGKGSINHYVLDNGNVYTIHIYGSTGNEFIDVFLPKEFEKPTLSPNAHPDKVGFYNVVSVNKKTGAVLSFAHLDSIQSQAELDKVWNSKITNSVGSRYIGTIGVSGGVPGFMHSHIMYFVSLKARDESRAKKIDTYDERNPKYFRDFRTLVDSQR